MNWTNWAVKLHWNNISAVAEKFELCPFLVAAIVQAESAGDPWATRVEKDYKWTYQTKRMAAEAKTTELTEIAHQKTSWGLLQLMGAGAREMGFKGALPKLCLVKLGLTYGCLKLSLLSKKYDKLEDIIASYNAGSPRYIVENGNRKYVNQAYVDKVMGLYLELARRPESDD